MLPDQPLRHLGDLDSMDWLNFLVSVHEHFGVTLGDLVNDRQKKQV